jgi:hypothetical protein
MADNVTLPGTGAVVATDEVNDGAGLRQFQVIKPAYGADGSATLVSTSNGLPVQAVGTFPVSASAALPVDAVGELIEAVEALRMTVGRLAGTQGTMLPDVAGRMRVAVDAITAGLTLATITTVTTVSTVSNQTQIGAYQAADQIPALMRLAADSLRRNISVT